MRVMKCFQQMVKVIMIFTFFILYYLLLLFPNFYLDHNSISDMTLKRDGVLNFR